MVRHIVGLDIGTNNTRVVIARVDEENNLTIEGFACSPSKFVRNGTITNITECSQVIKDTIEQASYEAGYEVESVFTAIGGSQTDSITTDGSVGVNKKASHDGKNLPHEITEKTQAEVIDAAQQVAIPFGNVLMHVLPKKYFIDDRALPVDESPVGQSGVRLTVDVLIVTVYETAYSQIKECINIAGYEVNGVFLKTLAANYFSVYKEERNMGSILIDLGAGSTDILVLNEGVAIYVSSIPIGGNTITNDIAQVLKIQFADAEKLKLEYGSCWLSESQENEEILLDGVTPRKILRKLLQDIIVSRVEDLMASVKKDIVDHAHLVQLNGSIILSGGGALLDGIIEETKVVWQTRAVRIAYGPDLGYHDERYRNADFATAVGLVLANKKRPSLEKKSLKERASSKKKSFINLLKGFVN